MTCTNRKDVFELPWTCWEKLTFNKSFISQSIKFFSFKNCQVGKKRRLKVVGHLENFRDRGQKPCDLSKSQATCDMAVIDTIQWVSMEKVMTVQCRPAVQSSMSPSPHLTVPLLFN